ncbi:ASC domain containing protein, partial [Asbolus verrucosus]
FLNNTSLHGLKYISNERTIVERLWWLISFCISLSMCVTLIINTWIKWEQSPVLINFASNRTPLLQITFPAITICFDNNINKEKFNFSDYHQKYLNNKLTQKSDIQFLTRLDELLYVCRWHFTTKSCNTVFSPTITNLGFCFAFNMLNRNDLFTDDFYIPDDYYGQQKQISGWDVDDGYKEMSNVGTFPHRTMSPSPLNSLEIGTLSYLGETCERKETKENFKVLLHHPTEFPRAGILESHLLTLPFNKSVDILIKPENIMTSSELKGLKPYRKKCYHAKEGNLQFFKIYTRQNCLTECIANQTLSKLGCIPFYMPCKSNSVCIYQYTPSVRESVVTLRHSPSVPNDGHSYLRIYFEDMEFISIERK